jgi:Subtilase family
MRSRTLKRWLVLGAVPATVAMGAIPAVAATATSPSTAGTQHEYIVFLRDQNSSVASPSRRAAVAQGEQAPVLSQLRSLGARVTSTTTSVNAVFADMTAGAARQLAANPAVKDVLANGTIIGPSPLSPNTEGVSPSGTASPSARASTALCGTATRPQLNPEALYNINAESPRRSDDGAGVTVATVADGLSTSNVDFRRNAAFSSAGSPAGAHAVSEENFSGDASTVPTPGEEAFLDASSIAAQGNATYNLNNYLYSGFRHGKFCGIKIQGDAPGANVVALKVFSEYDQTTNSAFVQAINWAVAHKVQVLSESFGSNNYPSDVLDAIDLADDAAVASGVTVVASTGDSGYTNTVAEPASDPNIISVGASTTFRSFEQFTFGGINDPAVKDRRYLDNNVAAISSGGVAENGSTLDLVAPGDWNWALCSSDIKLFTECATDAGKSTPIQFTGGTSEAAPLTAGAAADVIQVYAANHHGVDPTPAVVKQILMSSATDINSPATEQGAGMLNVAAAVALARTYGGHGAGGGIVVSTGATNNQVNVQQDPSAHSGRTISLTNTSSSAETVHLSTREQDSPFYVDHGNFCMQTGSPTKSCRANSPGVLRIWSGVKEVFQNVHFYVPRTHGDSRLNFQATYPYVDQTSLLHVALVEPDGRYAAYSDPQGLSDYADAQVSNPPSGVWTAVFFTEKNGYTKGAVGSHGVIHWAASTSELGGGSSVSPSVVRVRPGQTATVRLRLSSPAAAGDTSESLVVSSPSGRTTVPVVVRTLVRTNASGGSFSGSLSGGNGRAGSASELSSYSFNVPAGTKHLDASLHFGNDENAVIAQLVDPDGQTVGYSTNITYVNGFAETDLVSTNSVNMFNVDPAPGQWTLLVQLQEPVTSSAVTESFSGALHFGTPDVSGNLPHGATVTGATAYKVSVHNSSNSPEWYFVDARGSGTEQLTLPDQNSNNADGGADLTLPIALPATGYGFPYYVVPSDSTSITQSLTGSVPVDFDSSYFPGDPDVEGTVSGDSATATVSNGDGDGVSAGAWSLVPAEIGPFGAAGAPKATASASMSATTQPFAPDVTSSTGDFWADIEGLATTLDPVYVAPGKSATITVTITPSESAGTAVSGTLYVDDVVSAALTGAYALPDADQVAALPFSYTAG